MHPIHYIARMFDLRGQVVHEFRHTTPNLLFLDADLWRSLLDEHPATVRLTIDIALPLRPL